MSDSNWKPWHILIAVDSYGIKAKDVMTYVRKHGKFMWKSQIVAKQIKNKVYIYAPCVWPANDDLKAMCSKIVDNIWPLESMQIDIFRSHRLRRLIWNRNECMAYHDTSYPFDITVEGIDAAIQAVECLKVPYDIPERNMELAFEERLPPPSKPLKKQPVLGPNVYTSDPEHPKFWESLRVFVNTFPH